jgi:hypothetical protein
MSYMTRQNVTATFPGTKTLEERLVVSAGHDGNKIDGNFAGGRNGKMKKAGEIPSSRRT